MSGGTRRLLAAARHASVRAHVRVCVHVGKGMQRSHVWLKISTSTSVNGWFGMPLPKVRGLCQKQIETNRSFLLFLHAHRHAQSGAPRYGIGGAYRPAAKAELNTKAAHSVVSMATRTAAAVVASKLDAQKKTRLGS